MPGPETGRAPLPGPGGDGGRPTRPAAALGRAGEELAAAWYEARGYEVLARNWRCRLGEIDLVCRRGRALIVCEVKARSSDRFGTPAEAVSVLKQRRLRRLALAYLAATGMTGRVRFDVATLGPSRVVEVLEAAF